MPSTATRESVTAVAVIVTAWLLLTDLNKAATALDLAKEAVGGPATLNAVKTLVAKGKGRTRNEAFESRPQGNIEFLSSDVEIKLLLPDHYLRIETTFFATRRMGFAAAELLDAAFGPGGQPAEWTKAKDQLSLRRDDCARLLLLLLLRGDSQTPLTLRQSSTPFSIDATGLMSPMQLDIDPATHLPLRLKYRLAERSRMGELTGQFSEITEAPGDYRAVGGLRMPFRLSYSRDGVLLGDVTFSDIQINPRLSAAGFTGKE